MRLLFYAAVYPLWEGLDEWAHMAYVDHLRVHGNPPSQDTSVSGEIAASFSLVPLAPHLPPTLGVGLSHRAYWQLPAEERERRQSMLFALRLDEPGHPAVNAKNYQAQHPPLAYRLMQFVDASLGFVSLPDRVYALRFALVLLVSAALPLLWLLARPIFWNPVLSEGVCLILALLPGFAVYVARISNDALAIVLLAASLVLFATRVTGKARLATPLLAGAATAATALTKAYGTLLAAVFVVASAWPTADRLQGKRRLWTIAAFLLVFAAMAGWWYAPVFLSTGTLSGEALDVQAAAIPLSQRLPNLLRVDWWKVWMLGSESHIWISGWSFLLLDDWICWVFRVIGLAAFAGLLRAAFRALRGRPSAGAFTTSSFWLVPLPMVTVFVLAIAYQGWQIFNAYGDSTAVGWYLNSAANAEMVVLVAGLGYLFGARFLPQIVATLAFLLAALDLFTIHFVSLPYYAGLTAGLRGQRMPVLTSEFWPPGGLAEVASRLAANHPAWLSAEILLAMWVLYLAATLAMLVLAIRVFRMRFPADSECV